MLITDLSKDPYTGRAVILLYGKHKVGKTTCLLDLVAKHDQRIYLMSTDRGTMKIREAQAQYQGRIVPAYPENTLRGVRTDLAEIHDRVTRVVGKIGSERVWFALDTVNHIQDALLSEARKIDVRNPSLKENEKKARESADVYLRDMGTRVDYLINQGHMSEIMDSILSLPCNIVITSLEKQNKDREDRPVIAPAISGSSYNRIVGDVDIIIRMAQDPENPERRLFYCAPDPGFEAGDRSGNLLSVEPTDLLHIRRKALGLDKASASPEAEKKEIAPVEQKQ